MVKPSRVKIENIQEASNELEIEYVDSNYFNKITLALKRPGNKLKEKIRPSFKVA